MTPATKTPDGIHDPDLYARMSEPYASEDEANKAIAAFHIAVRKLRAKHRIADVAVVSCVRAMVDGEPQAFVSPTYNGDVSKEQHLLAFAIGHGQKLDAQRLARVIARAAGL